MLTVSDVTQDEITAFFLSDLNLLILGVSDEEIHLFRTTGQYPMSPSSNYLGIRSSEGELMAVVKYEWFTTHCANFHMYVQSKLHGTPKVTELCNLIRQHFEEMEYAHKVILMVPSTCEHVIKFAPKHGWVKEGCITKCYFWRQQPVDLVIFGLNLKENREV